MTDLGLASVLPPSGYSAFVVLAAGFALACGAQRVPNAVFPLHVLTLILFLHATPIILYETLRYSWAWKHVGIVDYILRHGGVDPDVGVLKVYHNWPGFFALSAFFTQAAGLTSALDYARWAPLFFNLINLPPLLLIMNALTRSRRTVWLAVWIFYLGNWIGQDYFSPQALSFFLYLIVIAACLWWFGRRPVADGARRDLRPPRRPEGGLLRVLARDPARSAPSSGLQRGGVLLIVVLLLAVIASSHQLTPIQTILALAGLVLFGRVQTAGLPVLMTVVATTWMLYVAHPFFADEAASAIASLGALFSNLEGGFADLSAASPGQVLVAAMARASTAAVGALAVIGGVRRLRRSCWDFSAAVLAVSPLMLLVASPYGGEITFRTYFFALPLLAFFAGAAIFPGSDGPGRWRREGPPRLSTLLVFLVSCALMGGFLFAHYGKDAQYRFTQSEIDGARFVYETAPPNSLLIEGARNYPSQFHEYEKFTYVPLVREDPADRTRILADPVGELSRWMSNPDHAASYVILTRSQKVYADALGLMPPGALDRLEQALAASPRFRAIWSHPDISVFVLDEEAK